MKKFAFTLAVLAAVLFADWGSTPSFGGQSAGLPAAETKVAPHIIVDGFIAHDARGYYIRGRKPSEIFRILNPNPAVLDPVVKAGHQVRLEVGSVVGDNVVIESLAGVPYTAPAGPKH